MRRVELIQIVKNVSSSWIALGTNVLVGIFLSPFILHRLGDAAFGIWVLIFSITGYYGLFDLGIRSSLVRYISKAHASNDIEYASRIINTTLFSYTSIGTAALLITVFLSTYIASFQIRGEFPVATARSILLLFWSAGSLGFPPGVSGGGLAGLQRFDVMN